MTDKPKDMATKKSEITPPAPSHRPADLVSELDGALGRRLRDAYSKLVDEPLPDKFRDLLDSLGKPEGRK